jgi:hypothetical protein
MSGGMCRHGKQRTLRSRRGMASALIIMILVLLIFMAVLSLVSSAADLRLSRKRADWNQQFYQADAGTVELVAGLDQFCRSAGFSALDPAMQEISLDEWLAARKDIEEYQITSSGSEIQVDLLAGVIARQGIQVSLLIRTGQSDPAKSSITIVKWMQWQAPFDYDTENGGIWKG